MSLLLLLQGAQVAGDDRTFTATWEQSAATWDATVSVPVVVTGVTPRGPRLGAATVTGAAGARRKRVVAVATFAQAAASWRSDFDFNDDELAIAILLGVPN